MQFQPQVVEALKQLPPAERVVAIALKNIYQKIKNLYEKEKQQIDTNRQTYSKQFKQIQEKASSIIAGRVLEQKELVDHNKYFVEQQKSQLKSILQSAAPIKDYWLDTIKNSELKQIGTEQDWKILSHLVNVDHKMTENTVQLLLTFNGSPDVEDGTYCRKVQMNNGLPSCFIGDKLRSKSKLTQGLVFSLTEDSDVQDKVYQRFQLITYFINDLIPYSLRFYLGEAQIQGEQQDDDEDDDQDQDQDQNQKEYQDLNNGNEKGRKKAN